MARCCAFLWIAVMLAGCARQEERVSPSEAPASAPAKPAGAVAEPDSRPVIVAFGNSLTAGAGLDAGLSYADFLQKELDRRGYRYRVANEGISGDTTSGGVSRVDAAVSLKPEVAILELGANDGLRGLPVAATRANLAAIIDSFQTAGAKVLLCGMTLPRNYGPDYIRSFESVFRDLASEKRVTLIPFFLEGVATRSDFMQPDGLHPTAEGNRKVAQNVMKYLEPLLGRR